jgi:ABC-type multidrug transport system fused ATPase/permease subunit
MVFDKGEIIEEGSIKELLERDSRFKKLYELQSGTEIQY